MCRVPCTVHTAAGHALCYTRFILPRAMHCVLHQVHTAAGHRVQLERLSGHAHKLVYLACLPRCNAHQPLAGACLKRPDQGKASVALVWNNGIMDQGKASVALVWNNGIMDQGKASVALVSFMPHYSIQTVKQMLMMRRTSAAQMLMTHAIFIHFLANYREREKDIDSKTGTQSRVYTEAHIFVTFELFN